MIRTTDVELVLEEAERYITSENVARAKLKFDLAHSLLKHLEKSVDRKGKYGGPVVGTLATTAIDYVDGALDHPLMNVIWGSVFGTLIGRQVARAYSDSFRPLWVRVYQGLGDVERANGNDNQARFYYAEAMQASPNNPTNRQKMAEVS